MRRAIISRMVARGVAASWSLRSCINGSMSSGWSSPHFLMFAGDQVFEGLN